MRLLFALVLVSPLVAGCTPYLPVKGDFGTSALVPAGDIPPEFAEFNAYDPAVNTVLADQICATPVHQLEEDSVGANPGRIVQSRVRCATHLPIIGQ